jgi:hypothetical protein
MATSSLCSKFFTFSKAFDITSSISICSQICELPFSFSKIGYIDSTAYSLLA